MAWLLMWLTRLKVCLIPFITNHMEQIDTGAAKVADNMQSISAATEEQSASAQEIASASDSLARQAQDVQEKLQKFKF